MQDQDPFSQSGQFARAVRGILRPLVRALIAQNVTATTFYRIVKQTYVEVAAEMLGPDATDSRVSVVTGVHRRDVKEFRTSQSDDVDAHRKKVSTLSTVVGRWLSHPDYTDAQGQPVAIPRSADAGPSFEALVTSVSRDVRPRTVLDELTRQNILAVEDTKVRLLLNGLVGPADMDQRLHFFSHNLGDHMNAAVDNLLSETPAHLERSVFYNNLDAGALDEIEQVARAQATETLLALNALAANRQAAASDDPDATHRFRFGVFFYKEDEQADPKGPEPDEDR